MGERGAMVVWVTGATRGIGRAIAERFAHAGHAVAATGRDMEALRALASGTRDGGGRVLPFACDVTDEASVRAACTAIVGALGPVDALVNNAGTTVFASFAETSVAAFDALYTANLRGAFLCTRAVLPAMLARASGTIVMINSMAARRTFANSSAYAATKAGLRALADGLRLEVRQAGVRVLSVYPGATLTDIWPQRVRARAADRMMSPADVAEAVFGAVSAPPGVVIEDLVLQPIGGPLE